MMLTVAGGLPIGTDSHLWIYLDRAKDTLALETKKNLNDMKYNDYV